MRRHVGQRVTRGLAVLVAAVVALLAPGAVLLATAPPAAADPPTPTVTLAAKGMNKPDGIVSGPDGNLWFVDRNSDAIGRITPAGVLTLFSDDKIENPNDLTVGPDGALWFSAGLWEAPGQAKDAAVGRITTSGAVTLFPLAGGTGPRAITTGPDGNLWMVAWSNVWKMTPAGVTTQYTLSGSLIDIAAGPDGNLWITDETGENGYPIHRFTTDGVNTSFPVGYRQGKIVAGPDGAMWFTPGYATNTVGRITMAGVVSNLYPPTTQPRAITFGPDGNVWFGNPAYGSVSRLTTSGVATNFVRAGINDPSSIVAGPDGNVWFTNRNTGTIGRIAPDGTGMTIFRGDAMAPTAMTRGLGAMWFTNTAQNTIGKITDAGVVTRYAAASINQPKGIALGADGNLWFTNNGGNTIGQITPAGVVTAYTGSGIDKPAAITPGPDGALWFVNEGTPSVGPPSIGRITTAGVVTNITDPAIWKPSGITAGPDGNVWFTNKNWSGSVGRITPGGTVTEFTVPDLNFPDSITAGPDGNVWFVTNRGQLDSVGRVTPAGAITLFADYPNLWGLASITTGPDGALWFTNQWLQPLIGRMTTTGSFSYLGDGRLMTAGGITTGFNGRLWLLDADTRALAYLEVGNPPSAAPTLPAAIAGDGSATVSWLVPPNTGLPITSYAVTPYLGGVAQPVRSFASTSGVVTGLTNGSSYTFRVAAVNGAGTGPSSVATAAVVVGAPGRPTGATASPGNASASVSWVAPAANGSAITGYVVTPFVNGYPRPSTTFGSTATTQTVTGLTQGQTYQFNVAAINARGQSVASVLTPAIKVGTPKAAGTVVSSPEDGGAKVSLFAPNNNGSPITGYTVTPYVGSVAQPAQTFPGTATLFTLTGLTNATTYTFKITATNAIGTGPPSPATAAIVVGAPKAVAAPTASAGPGAGESTLTWAAPVDNGSPITGYAVQPIRNGVVQPTIAFDAATTTRTLTGLTAGATYTFRVAATNARGTGPLGAVSPPVVPT